MSVCVSRLLYEPRPNHIIFSYFPTTSEEYIAHIWHLHAPPHPSTACHPDRARAHHKKSKNNSSGNVVPRGSLLFPWIEERSQSTRACVLIFMYETFCAYTLLCIPLHEVLRFCDEVLDGRQHGVVGCLSASVHRHHGLLEGRQPRPEPLALAHVCLCVVCTTRNRTGS